MKKIAKSRVTIRFINLFYLLLFFFNQATAQEFNTNFYEPKTSASFQLKGNIISLDQQSSFPEGVPTLLLIQPKPEIPALDTLSLLQVSFDSTGKIINSKQAIIPTGKKPAEPTETFFNYNNGLLINEINRAKDKLVDSIVYEYGRYDRLNSFTVYNARKRVIYRYTFAYNSSRQLSIIRRRNEENYPVEMIKLKYNAEGILTDQLFYDENMKHFKTASLNNNVDDKSNNINGTLLWTDGDGNLLSGIMTVADSNGIIQEKSNIDKDRKVTGYNTYRYNDHGDLESAKLFANMENIEVSATYKYDSIGNWIEKQLYINGKIAQTTSRILKYAE